MSLPCADRQLRWKAGHQRDTVYVHIHHHFLARRRIAPGPRLTRVSGRASVWCRTRVSRTRTRVFGRTRVLCRTRVSRSRVFIRARVFGGARVLAGPAPCADTVAEAVSQLGDLSGVHTSANVASPSCSSLRQLYGSSDKLITRITDCRASPENSVRAAMTPSAIFCGSATQSSDPERKFGQVTDTGTSACTSGGTRQSSAT